MDLAPVLGPPKIFLKTLHIFIDFRERNIDVERETSNDCLPFVPQPGIEPHNLGMYPDGESDHQPFGVWDNGPTNRATRLGLKS